MDKVKTVCPYCGTGCGMYLHVKDGKVAEVTADPDHPVSQGELCVKGYFGFHHVADKRRLSTPLAMRNGVFEPLGWDAALNDIAGRLRTIVTESGPDSCAVFVSARATNEDNYAAQKFARAVLGTNNVDHCARLCHASTVAGLAMTLGSGAMTNSIAELGEITDVIFIIGSNTAECHPLIARHVVKAQQRGAKLIVADPRMTEMASKADLWIRTPLGHNIPLTNGMLHVIIKEKLYKPDFVKQHAVGFDDVVRAVEDFSPEAVERMSGIPAKQIVEAARLYAGAGNAAILYAMGVTQFSHGTANVASLSNLAVVTGQIGRPGAGVCPLRGQNNVQGACDLGGLPHVYPGYRPVTDPAVRTHFEQAWGASLSNRVGLKVTEVPHAIEQGKIRALVLFGENPLLSDPDSGELRHALDKLDLLVVADLFMTETARFADYVLPAAGWAEKDGTFTNTERRIQRVRPAVKPPGEARPDWWTFARLGTRMGYTGMGWQTAGEVWDEVRRVVPATFGGISYARIDKQDGLCWPCPDEAHPGTPILHRDGTFMRAGGQALLKAVLFDPKTLPEEKAKQFEAPLAGRIAEHPDAEYPFLLTTGRRVYHYHTGTMTRKSPLLDQIAPEELIELNPEDATALKVANRDFIKITTRRGHIVARAWVTERVPPKTVFGTFHFWEASSNELTSGDTLDPVCGIPEFKISAARVEKSSPAEAAKWLETIRDAYRVSLERATTARRLRPEPRVEESV
ncbi:formate dehydrogenase subunit alpha [Azospirillum halopraeferens]|uniref:formate dehydrogenase subunit alpha n=1 Tax=Azospirillum halopraeferens TaxID=34010 RepID=UPI0005569673|nr:formate dehydrogenase subunit alpha [Azospirillum halopraeferens]